MPGSDQDMFSDLVMDPSTYALPVGQQVLYAAVGEATGAIDNGVYMTADGGQNWQLMTGSVSKPFLSGATVGRITLAISPTIDPKTGDYVLYAAFIATNTFPAKTSGTMKIGQLYQLGYAEVSGSTLTDPTADYKVIPGFDRPATKGDKHDYVGTQGYYGTSLIVAPDDPFTIYAGGQDYFISVTGTDKTKPTVANLSKLHSQALTRIHVDHHGIAIDPNGTGGYTVLDGNDGGIYEYSTTLFTSGIGTGYHWSDLNTNLAITQMYGVAVNPTNTNQIYGAAQDNGNFWTTTTGSPTSWTSVGAGDGSEVYIDPTTNKVFATNTAALYTGDPTSNTQLVKPSGGTPGKPNGIPGNFPAPEYVVQQVVVGAVPKDFIWYGGEDNNSTNPTTQTALWLSTDGATKGSWHEIGKPGQNGWPTTQTAFDNGFQVENTSVDSIGLNAATPSTVYVGLRGGQILVTTNGTSTSGVQWTALNAPVSLMHTTISAPPEGQPLSFPTGMGTINVASTPGTAGFPTSGNLFVEVKKADGTTTTTLVTYTGKTDNSFTGCSGGLPGNDGTYTLEAGYTVTFQNDLRYSDIQVDPNNANIIYVTAANFGNITGGGQVWKGVFNGTNQVTWTNISGNLPNVPVWSIQEQIAGSGATFLYVGTDIGVFVSPNGGTSWSSLGSGLPNVQVRTMELVPGQNLLVVGTFGRGAYEINVQPPFTPAVYYPNTGTWYVSNSNGPGSTAATFAFGFAGTEAVSGDWFNNGVSYPGVYDPNTGTWYLDNNPTSNGGSIHIQFGFPGTIPVAGDFFNDGLTYIGVYYPPTGTWYIDHNPAYLGLGDSNPVTFQFGFDGTQPVVGNFFNDGTIHAGVYYPPTGTWYINSKPISSGQGGPSGLTFQYGFDGTQAVVGDWNNLGYTQIGVYYPTTGMWYESHFAGPDSNSTEFQYGFDGTQGVAGNWFAT